MTYSEKLKDPRWQRKRLEILQRDDFQCTCCEEREKTLHVHHTRYISGHEPWDYPDELLETLCADCHYAESQREMQIKEALAILQENLAEGFVCALADWVRRDHRLLERIIFAWVESQGENYRTGKLDSKFVTHEIKQNCFPPDDSIRIWTKK